MRTRRTNGGRQARKIRQVGDVHVPSDGIGDQIDLVPQFGQSLEPVVFAERGAARLEERLGREHQDAHSTL